MQRPSFECYSILHTQLPTFYLIHYGLIALTLMSKAWFSNTTIGGYLCFLSAF